MCGLCDLRGLSLRGALTGNNPDGQAGDEDANHNCRNSETGQHKSFSHNVSLALHFAEQGVGFHPEASGSFLKSELVSRGRLKYIGSSTIVVTVTH